MGPAWPACPHSAPSRGHAPGEAKVFWNSSPAAGPATSRLAPVSNGPDLNRRARFSSKPLVPWIRWCRSRNARSMRSALAAVADQLLVEPGPRTASRTALHALPASRSPRAACLAERVLHRLGGEAVGLVKHVDGLLGRRKDAGPIHVDGRQHEVMVGDHEVRLLDPLPRGLERAACELRALGTGATLPIRGDAIPHLVDHGQRQFVPIPAPSTRVEASNSLITATAGCVFGTAGALALARPPARQLALRLHLGRAGVAASALRNGEGEGDRHQALQAGRVLLPHTGVAAPPSNCSRQAAFAWTSPSRRGTRAPNDLPVPVPASTIARWSPLPACSSSARHPGQRVSHRRDHLHLRPSRLEARMPSRSASDALANRVLLFLADHAAIQVKRLSSGPLALAKRQPIAVAAGPVDLALPPLWLRREPLPRALEPRGSPLLSDGTRCPRAASDPGAVLEPARRQRRQEAWSVRHTHASSPAA